MSFQFKRQYFEWLAKKNREIAVLARLCGPPVDCWWDDIDRRW